MGHSRLFSHLLSVYANIDAFLQQINVKTIRLVGMRCREFELKTS